MRTINIVKGIKFTWAEENTNTTTLPFLDILISRGNDGKLETQVYHKTTHTNQVIRLKNAISDKVTLAGNEHLHENNRAQKASRTPYFNPELQIFPFEEFLL
uniref:Uncharacterized protein n=1 Tax=Micrurus spixii TaxID=129469 RepID=A0A2D4LD40_9SAUR